MCKHKNMSKNYNQINHEFGRWLSSPSPGEEVVISGISGHFPESNNIHEFRDHLFAKREMVTTNETRWNVKHPEEPHRTSKIPYINKFDAGFFEIGHVQASNMDPMMRVSLEKAIEAIFDAGINPSELEKTKTGVFVAISWSDVEHLTLSSITEPRRKTITGFLKSFFAHRLSYFLKLKGPSFNADSACSSSMNALDAAFRAIRTGKCEAALVGSANLVVHPGSSIQFYRLGLLSKEGICKVFDQDASGYVRGEAIPFLFLQKAKNSKRIYAQIVHSKINCDGFKEQGITFPSRQTQVTLMEEIYKESCIHPSKLSFVECHGTGTQVGDPQEADAIDEALAQKRDKPLFIGAVKSSTGHTETSSGLCSIIKVLIAMQTGFIPPNINFKQYRKGINGFDKGRMKVILETTKLEDDEAIVGVNNFGFGGNNAHVILKRFKKNNNVRSKQTKVKRLVCVSGRTEESVLKLLQNIKLDEEHIALLHQLYKTTVKGHLYRGYAILSEKQIVTSTKFQYYKSPLFVYFGEFEQSYKAILLYLQQPIFKTIKYRIEEALKNNFNEKDFIKNPIIGSIYVQLAIVNILKQLSLNPTVFGDSYGKLITAFYYNQITIEDVIATVSENIDTKLTKNWRDAITNKSNNALSVKRLPSNCCVLNVSDLHVNKLEIHLVENNNVTFLEALGKIYQNGYNPEIHKLYSRVDFPVCGSTPMIAPHIQWNHESNWYTYKFKGFSSSDTEQKEFSFSYLDNDKKYLTGHVIDGSNLIPATEYLNLVWTTYAQSQRLLMEDTPIVFRSCRFVRGVTMPKTGFITLLVSIQRGTGLFEVVEKNSLVVKGYVSPYKKESVDSITNLNDDEMSLKQDEIYRELYLRGYNYSGMFKEIVQSNKDATSTMVRWKYNWVTFIENMLQVKILQNNAKLLFVPTGIKKMTIDPKSHLSLVQMLDNKKPTINVHYNKKTDTIKAGGIAIYGLQTKSISRQKTQLQPVLEKHVFVPNCGTLELAQAVRVNTQIILENSLENYFKAVEVIDDNDTNELMWLISEALNDVPVVTPDLTISTKQNKESTPEVKIEVISLTADSNFLLIIGTKLFDKIKQVLNSVSKKGFILTREETDFQIPLVEGIEIVTEFVISNEKIILLKKTESHTNKCLAVTSQNLDWLPELQNLLKQEDLIILYSSNKNAEGILGFINCLRKEPGGQKIQCFITMDAAPDFDVSNSFYDKQIKKNLAINIYKDNSWGTYRHLLLEEPRPIDCQHCFANVTTQGDFSTLKWLRGPLQFNTPLQKEKVLIKVHYTALNLKDAMVVTGKANLENLTLIKRFEKKPLIGSEFSGKDLSGRRFMAMHMCGALSTLVATDRDFVWDVPSSWSLEDAATVPVSYLTAIYALLLISKLTSNTAVLIHSATRSIGLAALNLCLYFKCKVFVTLGTQEQRNYLKKHFPQIPNSQIGNSRDTSYEKMIKKQTGDRGVDIVLNSSLGDEKFKASVRCLAKGGKFIEMENFNLSDDTNLELLAMEKGVSYHGIMLDNFFSKSKDLKMELMQQVERGLELGYIKPLPRIIFEKKEIEKSFRYMITEKYIEKVLISIRDEESNQNLFTATPRFNCDSACTYVIVGGLGGVGLELADFLVLRDARKIVLVSRSGVQTGYQTKKIQLWESYGVQIKVSKKDVTTKEGCIELLEEANALGKVDGIFNLAVLLKDALFEDQTKENFIDSLAPKATTTKYLDETTRELCPQLRYFVVFSSVSSGRGLIGQTNYGMANSIMETICEKRKTDGLPALAIQWGAIGEVGLVTKMQKNNKELVIGGTLPQKICSCLEVMDKLLEQDYPVVCSMVVAKKHKKFGSESAVEAVAQILGIKNMKTVSQHSTLSQLGMDSMMGAEVTQLLEKDFNILVTPKQVRSLTVAKLKTLENEKLSRNNDTTKTQNDTLNLFKKADMIKKT